MRALVVGGLAGAAWLLTGAAAHAADRDPADTRPSLTGSVVHDAADTRPSLIGSVLPDRTDAQPAGEAGRPVVTRVLQAAARPLDPASTHDQHQAGPVRRIEDVVEAPARIVDVLGEVTPGTGDAVPVLGGIDRAVRELTAPLRLTGGPVDDRQVTPVTAPLTRVLRPVTDLLPQAATPVSAVPHPQHIPAAVGPTAAEPNDTHSDAVSRPPAGERNTACTGHLSSTGHTVGRLGTVTADVPQTVRRASDGDGSAPLQVPLGAVSGIPAAGPGSPTEGGSAAFLPVATGEAAVACHRLPFAAGVEVRRHDAEAPTVSPD